MWKHKTIEKKKNNFLMSNINIQKIKYFLKITKKKKQLFDIQQK